jgi:hypothetical protein
MKRKTQKQLNKELMDYIMRNKLPPEKAREIFRASIEKRIYERFKKLH